MMSVVSWEQSVVTIRIRVWEGLARGGREGGVLLLKAVAVIAGGVNVMRGGVNRTGGMVLVVWRTGDGQQRSGEAVVYDMSLAVFH